MVTAAKRDYWVRASIKLGSYIDRSVKNPRWFFVFALARFDSVRRLSKRMSRPPAPADPLQFGQTLFRELVQADVVAELEANGLAAGINLPEQVANEILQFALTDEALANGNPEAGIRVQELQEGESSLPGDLITATFADLAQRLPIVEQLQRDPKLVNIASAYLNTKPTVSSRLWWSFPANSNREQQLAHAQGTFHYDPDVDFNALKFFFYITEVDAEAGPHVCVRGSHKRKRLGHKLTLFIGRSDDEIEQFYGSENVVQFTGPAGFGIAEDPMCFHKGQPPASKARLMLEVSFRSGK